MIADVSPTAEPDPAGLIEAYFERGWTDGLPVVPPTEKSIALMLAGAGLAGDETIGVWDGALKNYGINYGNDYGGRLTAAWLDR